MLTKLNEYSHIIGGAIFMALIAAAFIFGSFAAPM